VDARRKHQGGEAVDQLERGQELRATAAAAWFWLFEDEVRAVELAQPVWSEWWVGAATEQTLASDTVGSLDVHRAIDGKPAPCSHCAIEGSLHLLVNYRAFQVRRRVRLPNARATA
jgi:hypothetical protein